MSTGVPLDRDVGPLIIDKTGPYAAFEFGWAAAGNYLLLTLFDGACSYSVIQGIVRTGPQKVTIKTKSVGRSPGACTANLVARTTELAMPPGISRKQPLQVLLFNQSLVLPAQR